MDIVFADQDAFDEEELEKLKQLGIPVIKKRMQRSVELWRDVTINPSRSEGSP